MNPAELLWNKLLDKLEGTGILSLSLQTDTPAEIARKVQLRADDDRVHRFIWMYYYPQVFGLETGTMSEAEAEALVQSFHGYRRSEESPASTQFVESDRPTVRACEVCNKRRTIAEVAE